LAVKKNAAELLEKQLAARARRGEHGIIALSSATDPYMPLEKQLGLTRKLLNIIRFYRFPVEIATKSPLVVRDLDILKDIDKGAVLPADLREKPGRGAVVSFSFSTVDPGLAAVFEPGAPSPEERLSAMKKTHDAGLLTGGCVMPVLPYLTDSEEKLGETMAAIKKHGGSFALVGALTLYGEGKEAFFRVIEKRFPNLLEAYRRLYLRGSSPDAEYCRSLGLRAEKLCAEYGLAGSLFPEL
jgi:DNA repair photolyase